MRQVLIQAGNAVVVDVPAPVVGDSNILVQVEYSCISVGTEMAGVKLSGLPLYRRALKQPANVKRVLEMVRDEGLMRTIERVNGKLAAGTATGYSAAGSVIAVGGSVSGFAPGDKVACAGAGIANHAEIIDVPVNLAVPVPAGLSMDVASSVTLGAIALQGVRRAQPTLGETMAVVGLGVLGQLTVQMLRANGCRVIGIDPDAGRVAQALAGGMHIGIDPRAVAYDQEVLKHTDGFGVDGVIITAATPDNEVVNQAMRACRRKGRVVLVGDVGLGLQREDMYRKEIDFLISTSYGPGRYDANYESGGHDYPIGYVRWTENRNMDAYLQLLQGGAIRLDGMHGEPFDIGDAPAAYQSLKGDRKPLMVFLRYPAGVPRPATDRRVTVATTVAAKQGAIQVGLAGASSFAQGVHLPNMSGMPDAFSLRGVMSRTGANARQLAQQYKAAFCTADYDELLRDPEIELVMIATRHDLHAPMAIKAIEAGKHVFVEKPLAMDEAQSAAIVACLRGQSGGKVLMTGYNRRFSPAVAHIDRLLAGRSAPLVVNYVMNAGYIPRDHWVHGPEGGGRNIGEACHIYDLFVHLCGGLSPNSVSAHCIGGGGHRLAQNDNFVATLGFPDGSVCTLTYTALGDKAFPKERMEVFADGKVIILDDYRSVDLYAGKHAVVWSSKSADKGHRDELRALAKAIRSQGAWPISLEEQLASLRISLQVEAAFKS